MVIVNLESIGTFSSNTVGTIDSVMKPMVLSKAIIFAARRCLATHLLVFMDWLGDTFDVF